MNAPPRRAEADRGVIVLEVPEPLAGRVSRIQAQHRYHRDPSMPIHITIAGSNGIGELELGDVPRALSTLDSIAALIGPIPAAFGPVVRFPGTNTFALIVVGERLIADLHRAIAESGLRFEASPFPFQPHCTLTSGVPVSEAASASLLGTRVFGTFVLDSVSLYAITPPIRLLHRAKLTRSTKRGTMS